MHAKGSTAVSGIDRSVASQVKSNFSLGTATMAMQGIVPAQVFAGLALLGLGEIDPSLRMAAVLMAAMPMMGIYPTLAQAYGEEDVSAVALLAATVTSFFTISAWLWMFRHIPVLGQ